LRLKLPTAFQNIERLEAGDDDRHPIARRDRLVFLVAHDGADMARGKKALNPVGRRIEQRTHCRQQAQREHNLENVLRSLTFIPKGSCRAIQIADLFAFYSRRDSAAMEKAKREGLDNYQIETMIKIITEGLPHRGFVATDFGPDIPASRFLGGDL
jgi:hypothetical protein